MNVHKLAFLLFVLSSGLMSSSAWADRYWTEWVSEEDGNSICTQWNEGVVGFRCSGKNCDKVSLLCETFPDGITLDSNSNYWTKYFSEEKSRIGIKYSSGWYQYVGDNYKVCHPGDTGGIVQGISCSGNYCDNISLECSVPVRRVNGIRQPARLINCSWTGWYSEEPGLYSGQHGQGSVGFGPNRYITGVQCSGDSCDNKSYHVCSLTP